MSTTTTEAAATLPLLDELAARLPPAALVRSPAEIDRFVTDFWGQLKGRTSAVLRPGSTAEVALIVREAARHGVALVPQSGNTGLVGGGIPDGSGRQLLLSLERLNRIIEIDEWQLRRPLATGFSPQFVDFLGTRSILIDFNQPGAQGPEHVRLYVLPRGTDWFRVICTTTLPTFDKYKETFQRIALSVTATGSQ